MSIYPFNKWCSLSEVSMINEAETGTNKLRNKLEN